MPRGSTSTGSVFAVRPAALFCDRERTLSTLKRVCVSKFCSHVLLTYHRITDLYFDLTGKLYCRPHFDQRNSGTSVRRTFSLPSVRPVCIYPPRYDSHQYALSNFSSRHILSLRIVRASRSDVMLMKKSPAPAVQRICRVNLQQVPSARS